jgi:hypothetical protein
VVITINAQPDKGLLGQLLCGLAGGGGVTDLAGLQSLLSSLGVNLSTAQLQALLNQRWGALPRPSTPSAPPKLAAPMNAGPPSSLEQQLRSQAERQPRVRTQ